MTDHSCSYYCDRPECIRSQRDFLRDLAEQNAAPQPVRSIAVEETQAGVGKAAAVAAPTPRTDDLFKAYGVDMDATTLRDGVEELERELSAERDRSKKFMWQVRDTCTRAEKAEAALAEARAEIARLREDAERYRWIRQNPQFIGWDSDYRPDEIDTQVDAARKETK